MSVEMERVMITVDVDPATPTSESPSCTASTFCLICVWRSVMSPGRDDRATGCNPIRPCGKLPLQQHITSAPLLPINFQFICARVRILELARAQLATSLAVAIVFITRTFALSFMITIARRKQWTMKIKGNRLALEYWHDFIDWRTNGCVRARAQAYVPRAVSLIRQLRFIVRVDGPGRTDWSQTPLRASSSSSRCSIEAHSDDE